MVVGMSTKVSQASLLTLKNVTMIFGSQTALHPTNLDIPKQKTTVLLGPSGCGKSTLLRLCLGLMIPSTGEVIFEGTPVTSESALELRKKMGYVIQDGGLFPHLTAYENIALMARHLEWTEDRIQSRIHELIKVTQFPEDGLTRYPVQISGGQRQRVSFMRALMLDPDVLFLDEPFGALDPVIRADLQEDLKHMIQSLNKTVVMVTHDIGEAAYAGDHIVFMKEGRILQEGSFEGIVSKPKDSFVTRFIRAQRTVSLDKLLEGHAI